MDALPVLLPQVLTLVALVALALALLGLALAAIGLRRAGRTEARYRRMMTGVDGEDLAAALEALADRVEASAARLDVLDERAASIERRLARSVRHVALHRFSAFDSGGDQSFAVALLDDGADGVVLSGLYARGGMRVYAKPVGGGRSPHALTTEEQRVIDTASGGAQDG